MSSNKQNNSNIWITSITRVNLQKSDNLPYSLLFNWLIPELSFPTEAIITELRESIKQLSAENKEKHVALEDARSELKELKEVVESVSTKNYVFVILYYSNYTVQLTVFELDSSFKSFSICQSFTIIFVPSFFLHHSFYSLPSPSCSDPLFLGLFLTLNTPPPLPQPWALLIPLSYSLLYSFSPGKKELQRIHVTNGVWNWGVSKTYWKAPNGESFNWTFIKENVLTLLCFWLLF